MKRLKFLRVDFISLMRFLVDNEITCNLLCSTYAQTFIRNLNEFPYKIVFNFRESLYYTCNENAAEPNTCILFPCKERNLISRMEKIKKIKK